VNPDCKATLRSFCDGRVFQFEIVSISISVSDDSLNEQPERQTSHFWLCGRCADEMTLVLDPQRGLRLVPLNQQATGLSHPVFPALDEEQINGHKC
jgi:hypothetical protein